jgi:hypothetical protein
MATAGWVAPPVVPELDEPVLDELDFDSPDDELAELNPLRFVVAPPAVTAAPALAAPPAV